MLTVFYNFTNHTDEVMTQRELIKFPKGQDFVDRWTWDGMDNCYDHFHPFRMSNSCEDYLYVRVIEDDRMLAIGAIRIRWNTRGDMIVESNLETVVCEFTYHYCESPAKRYDLEHIIKTKLYEFLNKRMCSGRCHPPVPPHPDCRPPHPGPCEPCKPVPPHDPNCPYHRGYDDRGLDYRNHSYIPRQCDDRPNPPKNGPYGGTYNAFDDLRRK